MNGKSVQKTVNLPLGIVTIACITQSTLQMQWSNGKYICYCVARVGVARTFNFRYNYYFIVAHKRECAHSMSNIVNSKTVKASLHHSTCGSLIHSFIHCLLQNSLMFNWIAIRCKTTMTMTTATITWNAVMHCHRNIPATAVCSRGYHIINSFTLP